MNKTRHRYPTTPLRLAETLEALAKEAAQLGALGSGQRLLAFAAELREDPCRERILTVARDVRAARALAREALDAEDLPRAVYLLWLRADDIAGHPHRLNAPSGVALLGPEERRALARKAAGAQPKAGSPEAAARSEKAMGVKRERRTVAVFTDDQRERARESRCKLPPERLSQIGRMGGEAKARLRRAS